MVILRITFIFFQNRFPDKNPLIISKKDVKNKKLGALIFLNSKRLYDKIRRFVQHNDYPFKSFFF